MSRPGDPDAIDNAPITVEAHVDNDAHTVIVELWRTSILSQLVAALRADDAARAEFLVWLTNAHDGRRCTVAKKALDDDWRVRDALTLTLHPDAAWSLAERVEDAAREPYACIENGCGNYTADAIDGPGGSCNAHLAEQSDGEDGQTVAVRQVS